MGATPRLVDVDPDSQLITAESVAASAGVRRVRCVMPGAPVTAPPSISIRSSSSPRTRASTWSRMPARRTARAIADGASARSGRSAASASTPTKNLGAWGDGGAVHDAPYPMLAERVAAAARPRRAPALPAPRDWRSPRAWTPCRRPCCGASCRAWTPGTASGAALGRGAARRARARVPRGGRRRDRAAARAGGAGRSRATTCSYCAALDATRCASTSPNGASPAPCTTPTPIHLTGAYAASWVRRPGACRCAERLAERSLLAAAVSRDERRASFSALWLPF